MRVQIRDCNPPHRAVWKSARGRGKYPQYPTSPQDIEPLGKPSQAYYGCVAKDVSGQHDNNSCPAGPKLAAFAPEFPSLNDKESYINKPQLSSFRQSNETSGDEYLSGEIWSHGRTAEVPVVGPSPDPSAEGPSSQHGSYREWYDDPVPVGLTPSSSFGSSVSAMAAPPFIPYPLPNMGLYPPHPWMPPMPQHFPYPIPYMAGFPGFNAPPPPPHTFSSPGSDASGPGAGVQNGWGPIGGMVTVRSDSIYSPATFTDNSVSAIWALCRLSSDGGWLRSATGATAC
jgi:hypothetical protein